LLPDGSTTAPQFRTGGVAPYVKSTALGELSLNQMTSSILNTAPDATGTQLSSGILYKAFVHASIANQARGGICLISAGPDGIYYSATDGPGSSGDPIDGGGTIQFNVITGANAPAKIMDEFDDVRVFGGA
jgi:hypothetical protein